MSAVNGWMMMAWVWPALVLLARLTTAEEPLRDAHGALAGSQALFSDSEPSMETPSGGGFLPVLVWKFVKDGADASDLGRPQFLCSDTSLSVRLSLIRHSDLRLQDGRTLLSLQKGCRGSVRTVGPWLLLKLPYTSCHVSSQVWNGTSFHQLKLRYFDHLLRDNMTAEVACEDPATLLHPAPPAVRCRSADVTVKLPLGSRLQRVKALGKDMVVGRVQTTTTPDAVLVQISTPAGKDSLFEVTYLDSAGDMSKMLAACFSTVRGDGRDRRRRAVHQNQWDWLNPRHWHSVEPRQGASSSPEHLAASDDQTEEDDDEDEEDDEDEDEEDDDEDDDEADDEDDDEADDDEDDDEADDDEDDDEADDDEDDDEADDDEDDDEEDDDEDDDEEDDDEELDDAANNATTANMTDAQTNATVMAATLMLESEDAQNTSVPAGPRLGRGMADVMDPDDMEDEDYEDEEDDDDDDEEDDDDKEDDDDDDEDEVDYDDSTTADGTEAQTTASTVDTELASAEPNATLPLEPRLGRGMADVMEMHDDPEYIDEDDDYPGDDDEMSGSGEEDSDDSSTSPSSTPEDR